ncbi:MAG: hypothetical protein JOZ22_20360, partial [Acidobacteriia bacterium]|nr:hypothetical protein [Terriglobia bacterium]
MALLKNGMLMAIVAQGMLGLSLLWDKILLRKPATQNLVSYVFWMGAISIFGVILAFFGFKRPPVSMALLAFLRRGCAACRNLFLLPGAETRRSVRSPRGEGRLRPRSYGPDRLAAAGRAVGHHSLVAFALLVAGGFVMFLAE